MDLNSKETWAETLLGIPQHSQSYYLDDSSGPFLKFMRENMPWWIFSTGLHIDREYLTSVTAVQALIEANPDAAPGEIIYCILQFS